MLLLLWLLIIVWSYGLALCTRMRIYSPPLDEAAYERYVVVLANASECTCARVRVWVCECLKL